MGLQFAQGAGDPGLSLGEAPGEAVDVDLGAGGERLDVDGQADRRQRQLVVLGEMVADHREAGGVADVVVGDAAALRRVAFPVVTGLGVRAHASVLDTHREAVLFLGGQALASGLPSRRGPTYVGSDVVCRAERRSSNPPYGQPIWAYSLKRVSVASAGRRGGVRFGFFLPVVVLEETARPTGDRALGRRSTGDVGLGPRRLPQAPSASSSNRCTTIHLSYSSSDTAHMTRPSTETAMNSPRPASLRRREGRPVTMRSFTRIQPVP